MFGQSLVQEGEIRIEEPGDIEVVVEQVREETARLLAHRRFQVTLVVVPEPLGVGWHFPQLVQFQPLTGEAIHEGAAARVGEHAGRLCSADFPAAEQSSLGQIDQSIVGHAAPEEIREPIGDAEIVQRSLVGPDIEETR